MAAASCPRLRHYLDLFPTEIDGEPSLGVRDPAGFTDGVAYLTRAAQIVISLCDGARTTGDVAREFARRTGARIPEAQIDRLLAQLDELYLLDTPRFRAHHQRVVDEFRAAPRRAPMHAGGSYPGDPASLAAALADHVGRAPRPRHRIAGLVAPHIDFHRGLEVYGQAYAALDPVDPPDLVVVFGTDHVGVRHPFTLTRKAYDTPLGTVETDTALVDALARETGDDGLFADELHHRTEHSIEFQAVWLRHVYQDRTPPILPVLCGSLHECVTPRRSPRALGRVARFLAALKKLTSGRRVLAVAGADLAHVGPRFGDERDFDAAARAEVERADRAALEACVRADGDAFFASVASVDDRYRVCGLSPVFATLAYLDGRAGPGELRGYAQCAADAKPASFVSIAAVALPAR